MDIGFRTMDVFTTRPFGGNQLAIIPDARGLDTAAMQAVATEFNYSETTFVLPPPDGSDCIAQVRIFTPANELPFAGHPNVGTAMAVAQMGELFGQPVGDRFAFDEGAGRVDCAIHRDGGTITSARIRAPRPLTVGAELDSALVASCASLTADDIVLAHHRPILASVGLTFAFAEVESLGALGRAMPNTAAFEAADAACPFDGDRFCLMIYTRMDAGGRHLRTRMFAPLVNIAEDPATGSASAALAAFLARLDRAETADFILEQGVEMGRPSRLELSVAGDEVWVGGPCVSVMRGVISL